MINVIDDLATITTIQKDILNKLVSYTNWIIVDAVDDNGGVAPLVELDIGIGVLQLINRDVLEYRFVPSKELEDALVTFLSEKKNPLKLNLEQRLVSRITNVYKEIL